MCTKLSLEISHLMDGETELSDPTNLFSMSSKDLQAVDYIENFIHMGVASLKIEGRMKSAYYLATVVSSYRMLIDYIYEHGHADEKIIERVKRKSQRQKIDRQGRASIMGFLDIRCSCIKIMMKR